MPDWLTTALPFIKGVMGWSTASFIYESFVKPSDARRKLAHVLAEEVATVLQMVVHLTEYLEIEPKAFPADFRLHDDVYKALLGRVSELPDGLPGELILFYQRVTVLNEDSKRVGDMIDDLAAIERDPDHHGGLSALERKRALLQQSMIVWRNHLPVITDQADRLLRKLRVAETRFGRLGYYFRDKPSLNRGEVRRNVAARASELRPRRSDGE